MRKYQDLDGQLDRIQKQTLQGSCREIGYGIFNSFTPLQTTEQWKNRRISQIPENVSASTSTTDWSGMNSHQWQRHVITSSRTAMPENQHSSLCLEEIRSINSTCYYTRQGDTFTMTMDYPI